jgi:hypothetical protein
MIRAARRSDGDRRRCPDDLAVLLHGWSDDIRMVLESPNGTAVIRKRWFLAEGATGPFFECFVLLSNPGGTVAHTTTLTYLCRAARP